MDSSSFKNALIDASPTLVSLLKIGLSQDEALQIRSSFEIHPRPAVYSIDLGDEALNDLLSNYDVSQIEVGMVRFHAYPERFSSGWTIGEVEADYLILDEESGEVRVTDIGCPEHVIWRCSANGENFLSALVVAAKYLAECLLDEKFENSRQLETIRACATLAGGDTYLPFYKMLIGV